MNKLGFVMVNLAVVVIVYMIYSIIRIKDKKQTHYSFLALLSSGFVWILGTVLLEWYYMFNNEVSTIALYIAYIGLILSSPCILMLGIVFFKSDKISFSWKYALIFLIPAISIGILLTNSMHNLFYEYIQYNELTSANSLGKYFSIHTIYSYICILLGTALMLISSIKNSGIFSKQSICILIGILISFVFNFLLTVQIIEAYFYTNAISIFFTLLLFFVAIFKFKFLDLIPIALQKVVNIISDGYVVLNERNEVIDFNKAFYNNIDIEQGQSCIEVLTENFKDILLDDWISTIRQAKSDNGTIVLSQKKMNSEVEKYFDIEISPIFSQNEYRGTILLLKDITQHVKDMELIKQSQDVLMEQERLVTLGQLAGGMAHDINTPLSTIITGNDYFERLIEQFKNSSSYEELKKLLENENKAEEVRILDENIENSQRMIELVRKSINKISTIVNSVRDQIRNFGSERIELFEISKMIKDIELFLATELKKNACKIEIEKAEEIYLKGDSGKLEQVVINIVLNAIQAYENKGGLIKIKTYKENDSAIIEISDKAGGIPAKIAESLLKQIVSTKGSRGTGFGLYFSNSIIKGVFRGELTFETKEGIGTTFYITLPIQK